MTAGTISGNTANFNDATFLNCVCGVQWSGDAGQVTVTLESDDTVAWGWSNDGSSWYASPYDGSVVASPDSMSTPQTGFTGSGKTILVPTGAQYFAVTSGGSGKVYGTYNTCNTIEVVGQADMPPTPAPTPSSLVSSFVSSRDASGKCQGVQLANPRFKSSGMPDTATMTAGTISGNTVNFNDARFIDCVCGVQWSGIATELTVTLGTDIENAFGWSDDGSSWYASPSGAGTLGQTGFTGSGKTVTPPSSARYFGVTTGDFYNECKSISLVMQATTPPPTAAPTPGPTPAGTPAPTPAPLPATCA
jgi:hypothetical protein